MRPDEYDLLRETIRELSYSEARILIVDDDLPMLMFLSGLLERVGYVHISSTSDPRTVEELFERHRPDLLILDLHMPYLDGFGVMQRLRQHIGAEDYFPILVLTASDSPDAKRRALFGGAKDFLPKPFDPLELLLRVHNLLEARYLHARLGDRNRELAAHIAERSAQLLEAQNDTIERLAQVMEFHDDLTGNHTRRVGDISAHIAAALGIADEAVNLIRLAAPLHDVGKIGIPDAVLLKPGRLTPDEFEVVKMHPSIGARILGGGRSAYLQVAEEIALGHHERWDGMGYPHGLRGDAIPLPARIVAVADVFDALTHDRPYRPAWETGRAFAEIDREMGLQFDPHVVAAFRDVYRSGLLHGVHEGPTRDGRGH